MKTLIFLECERRVQPFVTTQLEIAARYFDRRLLITKELTSGQIYSDLPYSVSGLVVSERERRLALMRLFVSPKLIGAFLSQIGLAFKSKVLDPKYIPYLLQHTVDALAFYEKAKPLVAGADGETVVISTWFAAEAYGAALLKREFPEIKAFSFAHSFEVFPRRNRYVYCSYNVFKHTYLDRVSFISSNIYSLYRNGLPFIPKNVDICHIGSRKYYDVLNPSSAEECDSFQICSCSNLLPVKNLDMILDMLEKWPGGKVVWTHIGSGPLMEHLEMRSASISANNPDVTINLMGVLPNDEVQRLYSTRHFDVFLNVSTAEGLPVSIIEALSYGIPVIATDVGGTNEIIDTSCGGLLPSDATGEDLLSMVQKFRSEDLLPFRTSAYERWCGYFNAEKNIDNYFNGI